ncbi:anti-sigma factor RsiW [Nocardia transvalensis]|uniref:Anti-sigma factor RsiW n=1 Tax=Nocardia transvalensis TaxID=37333 RepID=A0A7W9UKS5_9NOCA|nr:zf-HC2 domain-containing protein [Nocardia transvalensis]MBB5915945.1 anti-sigma factor RsiW [Nocardia transvalensis]
MNCDEFVELVTAFLDGALDAETEQRFIEHLTLCDGCDAYLEQFRRTIRSVGELPPDSISPVARDTLLAAFRDWRH